jgi:outer membrane protein TolC
MIGALPTRARAPAMLLLAAALAGCASIEREQAIEVARDWSQRVDAQAPQLRVDTAPGDALRERLLAEPLGENAALQLALAQSPALQALLAESWRAQAAAAQRGAPPNPFFLFERVVTGGEVDITRFLGIGLTELLTWPWRSDIAQRDIDALRLQLAREVLAHNAEVRAAWVRAVAAQQLVIYHRQVQDAAAASAELARRMQAVGNFSRLQRAREQAFLADATTQLARALAQATVEREALVRKLGLDAADAERLQLPERLPDLPAAARPGDVVAQRAMDERLDLLLARAQLGAAQRAMGLETVQLFDIELAAVRELGPGGERGRGFEAGIVLPILDPGIALRQAASAKTLAAQRRFEQARIDAGSVLRERYVLYRSAFDLARWQRDEVVPLRRTITDEMLLKYNGMLVGVFELLADARAQVGAVIAVIEAQRDFWLADAALNAAIVGAPSQSMPLANANAAAAAAEPKGH